jgi:sugar O-acyltransferase (sialic acid O-acetyltransferase NeuD family)
VGPRLAGVRCRAAGPGHASLGQALLIAHMLPSAKNDKLRVLILGAGGHGRVVLDILLQARRHEVLGFLDNNPDMHGRRVDGIPVRGGLHDLEHLREELDVGGVIIAIGDNGARRGLARQIEQAGIELVSAVHPSATLAHNATIGRNVVIAAGVVVCANCQIGDSVILNTGCIIDHQTMIGEGSHICPGVRLAGRVKVEPGVFVGIGATVVPMVTLGCEAVVGAGAVVLEDVLPMATVAGVPARPIRLAGASEDVAAMLLPAQVTGRPT